MTTFVTNEAIEWLEGRNRWEMADTGVSQVSSFISSMFSIKDDHRQREENCSACKLEGEHPGLRFADDAHVVDLW